MFQNSVNFSSSVFVIHEPILPLVRVMQSKSVSNAMYRLMCISPPVSLSFFIAFVTVEVFFAGFESGPSPGPLLASPYRMHRIGHTLHM